MRAAQEIMAALASSDLTPEQLALVMELSAAVATECRPIVDSAAQRRRAKDRAYQAERRHSRQKSADAPPIEDHTPYSDPTGSGDEPPDEIKLSFDRGVAVLTAAGHTERQARAMVGKWNKAHGPGRTKAALDAASGKPDPLPYVEAILAKPKTDLDELMASIDRKYPARAPPTPDQQGITH